MAITNHAIALVYRIVAVLLIATGLVRILGIGTTFAPSAMLYYTVLSNFLCLIWLSTQLVKQLRTVNSGPRAYAYWNPRFGAAVMMAITVTMLVYVVLLAPNNFDQAGNYQAYTLTDSLIHVITPVLTIVDWFAFAPKGTLPWYAPLTWCIMPMIYLAFALTASVAGVRFDGNLVPYDFLDYGELGAGGVAVQVLILVAEFVVLGYVYLALDKLMAKFGSPGVDVQAPGPRVEHLA